MSDASTTANSRQLAHASCQQIIVKRFSYLLRMALHYGLTQCEIEGNTMC